MLVEIDGLQITVNDFDMKIAKVLADQYVKTVEDAAESSGNRAMYVTTLLALYLRIGKELKSISNADMIAVMERANGIVAVKDLKNFKKKKK